MIPDGFYVVDDSANQQPGFQRAIIAAVSSVTHIAEPDEQGQIIGAPVVDHGGTNWTVTPGALLGGVHVNIGEFVIPTNVVAEVAPFDGASGGSLEIRARHIRVDGVLNATGKGYSGGAGGGGERARGLQLESGIHGGRGGRLGQRRHSGRTAPARAGGRRTAGGRSAGARIVRRLRRRNRRDPL